MLSHEEAKKAIEAIVTSPESAPVLGEAFMKELDEIYTSLDTSRAIQEENEAKIKALQDTNMKLFLSVTGKGKEEEPELVPLTLEELSAKM